MGPRTLGIFVGLSTWSPGSNSHRRERAASEDAAGKDSAWGDTAGKPEVGKGSGKPV